MIRPLRAVVLETRLDATPADVWHALTDGQALADWFPRTAKAGHGVGGIVELSWDGAATWPTTIEVWDPERHLRWADSVPPGPDGLPQPRMFVDWFISTDAGQTVLRLVHSGFGEGATWDEQIDGITGGWKYFLWNLEQLLTVHRGRHRSMVWARRRTTVPRSEFWDALFAGGVLAVADAPAGQVCTLTMGELTAEGGVATFDPPSRFAARFPSLNDALLFVELEGSSPTGFHAGFWLSTYGLDSARVAELQQSLDETVSGLIEGPAHRAPGAVASA
jgi:uncharacterized protein YndB with AHSA1/START domain